MPNEKKTTTLTSQLKRIGLLITKVILALLLLIGIATIGMMYFPTLDGLDNIIRQHWIGLLVWRIVLYIIFVFLFFRYFRDMWRGERGAKIIRLFMVLVFVVEAANVLQIIQG